MKRSTKKVYVTNRGGHNYEAAEKYGEIVYITEGTLNRFATSTLYRAFVDGMADSQPDDYILITSMSIVNAIGAAVFARKHGCLNLLLFREGEYVSRELDIDSLLIEEKEEGEER